MRIISLFSHTCTEKILQLRGQARDPGPAPAIGCYAYIRSCIFVVDERTDHIIYVVGCDQDAVK